MPPCPLPLKHWRGIYFHFPSLLGSQGGQMTAKSVPRYQWVLQEFTRTRRISQRACAPGSRLVFLSGLHLVIDQRESACR